MGDIREKRKRIELEPIEVPVTAPERETMIADFEKQIGREVSPPERKRLTEEFDWFLAHGFWRCNAEMSNGLSDIRCQSPEGHSGAHRGQFANGSARSWGELIWGEL